MRRIIVVVTLCLVVLGLAAAPAFAWYAPRPQTAYIDGLYAPSGWEEWGGPDDPYELVHHEGPIPAGWEVVVATSWWDFRPGGAGLAAGGEINTFCLTREGGPVKSVTGMSGARYWSPVYAMVELPGAYARDWWASIGIAGSAVLPAGHHSGWFRSIVPRAVPTWIGEDDEGNLVPLATPVLFGPFDSGEIPHDFDVAL